MYACMHVRVFVCQQSGQTCVAPQCLDLLRSKGKAKDAVQAKSQFNVILSFNVGNILIFHVNTTQLNIVLKCKEILMCVWIF